MKIVIPMAGHSRRFRAAGFDTPKAFIEIDRHPMIHWVCDMFSSQDDFIFVAQTAHVKNDRYREILENAASNTRIIGIEPNDLGPVFTALAAEPHMREDEPVIISYCDFYQHWDYRKFLLKVEGYDGGIAAFRGYQPASFGDTFYAYLRVNENMEMQELREKQPFTDLRHEEFASSGVYYFHKWGIFRKYARAILERNYSVNSEYYVSLIYNFMVQEGLSVGVFEIDRFICWGTPEDLEQYMFWSDFFAGDVHLH